jgi:hypothetical protein
MVLTVGPVTQVRSCITTVDCSLGELCANTVCQRIPESVPLFCHTNANCQRGYFCGLNDICVRAL